MSSGLWRVGPLPAILAACALLGAACSGSAPTEADDPSSAATVIGGTGPAPSDPAASNPAGSDPASSVSGVEAGGAGLGRPVLAVGTGDGSEAAPAGDGATPSGAASPSSPAPGSGSEGTAAPSSSAGAAAPTTAAPTSSPAPVGTPGGSNVVGDGTAASCTSRAVVAAVAAGGSITFDCGPDPVTIAMDATAKVVNANGPDIVIDGGGLVTLSGQGRHRILYMNTCDQAQGWTTSHCQNQDHPRLTVRNLTFVDGNSTGDRTEGGGGGAIFVRGGRLKVESSTFVNNRCDGSGPDLGGAAIRALSQYDGRPVEVSGSTFRGGVCANGGAVSSIGVSWVISDTVMSGNSAVGRGANPARSGTPGGGSGGAIYTDGNDFTVDIRNSRIEDNHANEGGGAVFFVSNDRTGRMSITGSTLRRNPSDGFETSGFPGIFFLGSGSPAVSGSTLE